jgi:GTP cyclohydrolase II
MSLLSLLASQREARAGSALPFITLSYAQSLDGSLAAARGAPTAISCADSLRLTHELRAVHAAILVGVGTALADDPSLTVRLCAGANPVPVVVDAHLRLPPHARLVTAGRDAASAPIVLHAPCASETDGADDSDARREWDERALRLRAAGVRLVEVPLGAGSDGHVDLAAAFRALAAPPFNLSSVMVEGGASIIASLCRQHAASPEPLIGAVVVTLAPFLLPGGLHVGGTAGAAAASSPIPLQLDFRAVERVGSDVVALLVVA